MITQLDKEFRSIETYRDGVKSPLTEEQAKFLYESYLEEVEACEGTGWYACIVFPSYFNGEVGAIGVTSRSLGTDYLYGCLRPRGWEELVGLV